MLSPRIALVIALVFLTAGVALYIEKARQEHARQVTAARAAAVAAAAATNPVPVVVAAPVVTNEFDTTNSPRYVRADLAFEQQIVEYIHSKQAYWKVEVDAQDGRCVVRSYLEIPPSEADELARQVAVRYSRFCHYGPVTVKLYGPLPDNQWLLLAQANADEGKVQTAQFFTRDKKSR